MDTKILEIKTTENKIKNISSDIDSHYISLGEYIVTNEANEHYGLIKKNKLSADLTSIKEIFEKLDTAIKKREKIAGNKKKISEIDQKVKDTLRKINEAEKENNKHYIGIAETLYDLYKIDTRKMAEFEPYFSEVIVIDNKNKEINQKISEIENDKKASFFGKIKDTGEKAVLNSRKRHNYSLMLSYFRTAGEKMCMDRIYENAANGDIEALFVPYKNNLKIAEEFSLRLDTLSAEKNNLRLEIEDIMQEFNLDPNAFIKAIKTEKENALKDFGKKVFDIINEAEKDDETVLSAAETNSEINKILDEIKVLNKEKDELDKKIEQLKLMIEIDKTEKEISNYKISIEKRNQKIDELNEEIEEYINMINVSETQLDDLKKRVVTTD